MREVSCRVLDLVFAAAAGRGIAPERMAEGTGCSVRHLRDKGERIDWESFRVFMHNAGRVITPGELEAVGAAIGDTPLIRPFAVVARLLFTATDIYRWVFQRSTGPGNQMFRCFQPEFEELPANRLRLSLTLAEGLQPSPEWRHVTKGSLSAFPKLVGLGIAAVSMEVDGRTVRFTVDIPKGGGWLRRLRKAALTPFSARAAAQELKEAHEELQQRYAQLEGAREEVARSAEQLHLVNEAGKQLSRHTELKALGNAVSDLVVNKLGCKALRLSIRRAATSLLETVIEAGAVDGPGVEYFDLASGGELVGQLQAWGLPAHERELFEALRPWIAIALDNARSFQLVKEGQEQLEQRVDERTRALSDASAKLELSVQQLTQMDQQKTQFFSNASHELRTPLTLMLLPLETLLLQGELPADGQEKVKSVLNGCYRLLKLINDLLDLSKVEAGKMALRMGAVDLSQLLEQVGQRWRPVLSRRRVALELELPASLPTVGDAERLEQVAMNLMSNAVKHVPDGGEIRLGAARGGRITLWVENSGEGINPAELGEIFDRFGQSASAKSRRFGSSGLGLPLVRDIVELHSGTIEVKNEPGRRVRFEVSLPALQPRQDESPSVAARPTEVELRQYEINADSSDQIIMRSALPAAPSGASTEIKPTLLLVEDSAVLRRFLASQLQGEYHLVEAADGATALRLAKERRPDLVLSDLMMAEMDGLQLCRALKADPSTSTVPFIVLTARGDLNTKLEGLQTGADDFLVKPFHMVELQHRLRGQLRMRQLADQIAHGEKLVALGSVVAGVAHEILNPLNAIINSLLPVHEMLGTAAPQARELLELSLGAARRLEQMTKTLLEQVRAGEGGEADVDLNESVALAVQLLHHKAVDGPRLSTDFSAQKDAPHVKGEGPALNQVWINLIDNAIQAAGKHGEVRVRVKSEGDRVLVEVEDDGPGMEPPVLRRIFEPFFTTKPVGSGTGLGLSMARQVVLRHGGLIEVQSAPGEGARFTVTLPALGATGRATHVRG